MSDYRLEFGSTISPGDTDRLYNLLSIVSEGDELEITMDGDNPEQLNAVVGILENNEFNVSEKGSQDGTKLNIIAHRID